MPREDKSQLDQYWSRATHEPKSGCGPIKSANFQATPFSIQDLASKYLTNAGRNRISKPSLPNTHSKVTDRASFWNQVTDESRGIGSKSLAAPSKNVAKIDGRITFFEETDDEKLIKLRLDRHLDKQIELDRISELSHFWRDTIQNEQCPKTPTSNPGWLEKYNRSLNDTLLKEKKDYWQNQAKEDYKLADSWAKDNHNVGEMKRHKEDLWTHVVKNDKNDDSKRSNWKHEDTMSTSKSTIEILCEAIYQLGEKYEDGTASVEFEDLLCGCRVSNLSGALIRAKRYGLVYFDGELLSSKNHENGPLDENYIVLQVSIDEIQEAFGAMRARHEMEEVPKSIQKAPCTPKSGKRVTFK